MLAIRFARVGRKKQPFYRIVVSEKTKDMYGNHLEILGTYNPNTKETNLKNDRVEHWLKVGAQASETVKNLFITQGLVKADKKSKAVRITKKRQAKIDDKKGKAEEEAKAAKAAAEEPKEEVSAETPAEETPAAPEETKAEEPKEEEAK